MNISVEESDSQHPAQRGMFLVIVTRFGVAKIESRHSSKEAARDRVRWLRAGGR